MTIARGANILASFSDAAHVEVDRPAEVVGTGSLPVLSDVSLQHDRYEGWGNIDEARDGMRSVGRVRRLSESMERPSEANPNIVVEVGGEDGRQVRKHPVVGHPPPLTMDYVPDVIEL